MARKPCGNCNNAQAVRPGGLCNRCHSQKQGEPVKKETSLIPLDEVEVDYDLQARVGVDEATVEDYATALAEGDEFPPVVLYSDDDGRLWLADGFHRYLAHQKAGRESIEAEVREGSRRDAVLFSVGANAKTPLPRTAECKRRAVNTLLADSEWSQWSDREIARRAGVSWHLVSKCRESAPAATEVTYTRQGERRTMDVSGIKEEGKRRREESAAPSTAQPTARASSGESPKPKQPPAVQRDEVGMELDRSRSYDYRAALDVFGGLLASVTELAAAIDRAAKLPGGEALEKRCSRKVVNDKVKHGSNHLDALKGDIKASVPVASHCPYCHSKGRIDRMCAACKGTDWVSRAHWDQAPEDFREAVLMAYGGGKPDGDAA